MKNRSLITAILALGALVVQAQTTFIATGADISVTNSWDNGLPTLGNQGTVAIGAIRLADVDIDGWDIVVASGGTIDDQITSYTRGETKGGSILEIQTGGAYTRTSGTWRWHGGATMKVTGGDVDVSGFVGMGTTPGGFTLDMTGGTFDSIKLFNFNNGAEVSTINVSGGTAVFGVVDGGARAIDEANTFYNVSGTGSLTINNLDYATAANDTNIVVTISDAGQFVTHIFDNVAIVAQADRYIDFTTINVFASWTWTGKGEADFISVWNDGSLRHNGESGLTGAAFVDHFLVVGSSVFPVLPPEITDFTNGSVDGTWANALNWSDGVPSASKGVDGESGTITNGALTVEGGTFIGSGAAAIGAVDVTTYTAGASGQGTGIATGDGASGSLIADSGTLTGGSLDVGTGAGANGTLKMVSGSVVVDNTTLIGSGAGATGLVTAATFTLSGGADLTVGGGGADAKGTLVGGNTSTIDSAILRIATSSNAWGVVNIGTGTVTSSADLRMATGQDSLATLEASALTITDGADLEMATGRDSTATLAVANPIVLASTNGIFVGTGAGSSQNLLAADLSISGPIGNFGVGEGTGSSITEMFSLHETIGTITANTALELTAGNHAVTGITIADAAGSAGSLTFSGTATKTISGSIDIASGADTSVALDLASLVSGDHIAGAINVGRGDNSVGSLTYTNGNLETTGTLEVGTGGDNADATVLLKSLTGGAVMSVCNSGTGATGTVTVLENSSNGTVRVARGLDSVGTLSVGGTLTVGQYLNSAGLSSNAVGRITATTLNKPVANGSIQVAQGYGTDGSIIASDGAISANGLAVCIGNSSLGLFAVTNGMATLQYLEIASGNDSDGTVLVGITSSETNDVIIGTGSNSIGRLTLPAGTLAGADLLLGDSGAGGNGTIDLAGGNLVVTGAITAGAGATSFINLSDTASTITWAGKVSADFEALWDAGTLRRVGESGLTGAAFSEYFQVTGDLLEATSLLPVGDIVIAGPIMGGDMTISWVGVAGQTYTVEYKNNLVFDPSWTVYTNVTGTGVEMTVPVPSTDAETYYQVTSP